MAYTATNYMFTNTLFQYYINDGSGDDTDTTIHFRRIPNRTLTINHSDFQQNFLVIELWIKFERLHRSFLKYIYFFLKIGMDFMLIPKMFNLF